MKWFFVLNPKSGKSEPDLVRAAIGRHFDAPAREIYTTNGEESLRTVVEDAIARGAQTVVAAGGDGTVSGVADGLVDTAVPLGIIPTGSGNGFARELGIPQSLDEACQLIAQAPRTRAVDAILVGERYALLRIGIGFEANVIEATARSEKRLAGSLAYIWTAASLAQELEPFEVAIQVDDREVRCPDAQHVALVNAATLGAPGLGLTWGPHVHPDDGRIDVAVIKEQAIWEYPRLFWRAANEAAPQDESTRYWQARQRIRVVTGKPLPVHADGEAIGETPIDATVVETAVHVIVPTEA